MISQQAYCNTGRVAAKYENYMGNALKWLGVFGLVLLSLLLLANSMAKPVAHDEQMYCTAGILTADGKTVYRDFSYIAQPPYHAVLLAALYKVSHARYYLLVGRLASVACDILVVVFIVSIYRSVFGHRRTAGLLFGLAAGALCVFNPLLDYAAGCAWNHDAVMACVMTSLWLFVRTTGGQSQNRYLPIGGIVILTTLATCMRITTALVELVFFVAILARLGGSLRQNLRTTAALAGIALIVAAWPLWVLLHVPRAVFLNLVRIPALCSQWLSAVGKVYDKSAVTRFAVMTPAYLVLLVLMVIGILIVWRRWSNLDSRAKGHFILMVVLPAAFVVIAFIPPTMWIQYWGVPVPFLVTALAYPLAEVTGAGARRIGLALASCCVVAAVIIVVLANLSLFYQSAILLAPERWIPVRLHAVAKEIAAQTHGSPRVLTLGPLYALEADAEIYPELSCGDFAYRVADSLSKEERQRTHTVGAAGLAAMITDRPPAAILVGVEPSDFAFLEEPVRRAIPDGWPNVDCGEGLHLYVRPPGI